jgi:acetyl/propionyl-CoA carboxylase alpha subunit
VATNEVKAARSERLVAEQQVTEGQVLAPASGRVLKVPVTEGSVVMPGESVATIAANQYVLRFDQLAKGAPGTASAVRVGASLAGVTGTGDAPIASCN